MVSFADDWLSLAHGNPRFPPLPPFLCVSKVLADGIN